MWRWTKRVLAGVVGLAFLAALGAAYQWLATRRDLAATPPPGQLVDIGGYRLHLWCMGAGAPAVVLESGLGGGAFTWPQVQKETATFTRVCAYDRAGLGYSDPSPGPRTSGRIAQELSQLIERSAVGGPVVLVGASSGGFAARILASEHRELVAGLVLVDASHEQQRARQAAAGLEFPVPRGLKLVVLSASLGLLRLRGETLGLRPELARSVGASVPAGDGASREPVSRHLRRAHGMAGERERGGRQPAHARHPARGADRRTQRRTRGCHPS